MKNHFPHVIPSVHYHLSLFCVHYFWILTIINWIDIPGILQNYNIYYKIIIYLYLLLNSAMAEANRISEFIDSGKFLEFFKNNLLLDEVFLATTSD